VTDDGVEIVRRLLPAAGAFIISAPAELDWIAARRRSKADAYERVAIDDAGLTDEFIGECTRQRRDERRHECCDLQHDKDRAAADSVCYHES